MCPRASDRAPRLRAPARSAHASIAGYHYQFAYTALQWLKCKPGDLLYCEGNEDLDLEHRDGTVTEVQVKHRARQHAQGSAEILDTIDAFATAFLDHRADGRRCYLVFTSTAAPPNKRSSLLDAWISGGKIDHAALRAELCAGRKLKKDTIASLDRGSAWADFFASVTWKLGAPLLGKYGPQLQKRIARDRRVAGLDPAHVCALMTHEILDRSGKANLADRVLTAFDLDVLLNDLWLDKGVHDYGPISGTRQAYLAVSDREAAGVACIALFLDDEQKANRDYKSACAKQRNLPRGRLVGRLSELNVRDGFEFFSGLGFDVYAIVDTRAPAGKFEQLAVELVPYVMAREAEVVEVHGDELMAAVKRIKERDFEPRVMRADAFGASLALLLANAIRDSWVTKQFDDVVARSYTKLRVVCDLVEQRYFTQAEPPPWAL